MRWMKIFVILSLNIVITGLIFGESGCGKKEKEAKRVQTVASRPLPNEGFKARISFENPPASIEINSPANIRLKVKNMSPLVWPSKRQPDGKYKINLAYHWLDMGV